MDFSSGVITFSAACTRDLFRDSMALARAFLVRDSRAGFASLVSSSSVFGSGQIAQIKMGRRSGARNSTQYQIFELFFAKVLLVEPFEPDDVFGLTRVKFVLAVDC